MVGPGGYLVGWSTISGAAADGNDLVVAGGTVSPGFSPGTITVDGKFVMESGTLVLEIRSNGAGGWDTIHADSITLTGGTVIFKPTADYDSGAGFTVDFFDTSNLTIGPGVTIQIDPVLAGATFDSGTGALTVIGGTENDLNHNGLDDRLEAVLPAAAASLEWPVVLHPAGAPPVMSFRRLDSSLWTHNLTAQWSTDLQNWQDIAIPYTSAGPVLITPNEDDPDTIEVTLPLSPGAAKVFVRLAVSKVFSPSL